MLRSSSHTSFSHGIQRLKRDGPSQCASCPSLQPCPECSEAHMCQLSIPASCSECPVNSCVLDPAFRKAHNGASKAGGALGGILACAAIGMLVYLFYRQRKRRAKEAQRRMREATKMKMAESEKFRPGDAKTRLGYSLSSTHQDYSDANVNPFRDDSQQYKATKTDDGIDDDIADEDTGWTELREDGLTAYRKPPGSREEMVESDLASAKRRSIGAATHLSRITEGAEEEDEDRYPRYMATMQGKMIEKEEEPPQSIASKRGNGRISVVSTRSEDDERGEGESGESNPFTNRKPFSDSSDAGSIHSHITNRAQRASSILLGGENYQADMNNGWDQIQIQQPSLVHRSTGSPLIDLQGKKKPDIVSLRRSQLESPLTALVRKSSRPIRKPDLTLLLNDAAMPGSGSRRSVQSPESGTVFRESDSLNPTYTYDQFEQPKFPASELLNSHVYQQNKIDQGNTDEMSDNRLSTASASSAGSLAYVMSAPRIITPADQGGVQRLQLQQGKAQLIRVTGLQSNAEKDAKERGKSCEARIRNPQSADFSMLDHPFIGVTEEEEESDKILPYLTSKPLNSPRSDRHSEVPEEVDNEREDELVDGLPESGIHGTGSFSEIDEVQLQNELAQYPFKEVDKDVTVTKG